MKNFAKKFLTLAVAAAMLAGMASCGVTSGPTESNDGPQESVNAEMVQLNVYNYDGGYKTEWLTKAKARYEELHKNDVYGDKKGVQILVTPGKLSIDPSSVKKDK